VGNPLNGCFSRPTLSKRLASIIGLHIGKNFREVILSHNNNPGCLSLLFGSRRSNEDDISVVHTPTEKTERNYNYYVNNRFLSPAEHSFYLVALKVLGDEYILCPQVNMAAVFGINEKYHYMAAFRSISQKRVDFIVCDAITMKILFGIELDESSHKRKDRMERDAFVEKVFESSHLPLIRINTRESYSTNELKNKFESVLRKSLSNKLDQAENVSAILTREPPSLKPTSDEVVQKPAACPNCGSPFNIRVSMAGPNVGCKFYVCSRYPECKTSIKIEG
jgi:hypothetical protein